LTCSLYPWQPPRLAPDVHAEVVLLTLDAGGDPKAVVRGPEQLRGIADTLNATFDFGPGAHVLCGAPLYDCQGFDFGPLVSLPQAATLHLDDGSAGHRLARMLVEQSFDLYAATPRELASLLQVSNAKPIRNKKMRLLCSGVPLPKALAQTFHKRFGVPVLSSFHGCETGPCTIDLDGADPESVGMPLPGIELRVATLDGEGLSRGTVGPIWARGAGVAGTFLPTLPLRGERAPLARGLRDGWMRTGDVGYFDAKGRLHLSHRDDDLVKVDRRRVALGEIESCLEALANVKAARARVEYDDKGSTRIVVQVTPGGRCKTDALLDHCAKRLAPHKVPRRIEFGE
jgi:acyl-coenzyme A synthetase/AMP-(fatty) acid ligase